jgi:23S rRNA (adenine1618-N6)-methyltransferase
MIAVCTQNFCRKNDAHAKAAAEACQNLAMRTKTHTNTPSEDLPIPGGKLHPRNRHQGRYDFARLTLADAALGNFLGINAHGEQGINFADPAAVKALNRALLNDSYGIAGWDIPAHNLCPPVPGRADYVHYLADLLADSNKGVIPKKKGLQVLDIGTGANCIYPLIGVSEYRWQFVATDINAASLANAQMILDANPVLAQQIVLRVQTSAGAVFKNIVHEDEWFDLSMCNPPFHTSLAEAREGTQRKWQNLGKENVSLNFGGQDAELWCPGGELAFIQRMIKESAMIATRCFWFTTLVSKSASLPGIYATLKQAKVQEHKTIAMSQGQKKSRLVAWTFLNPVQQAAWRKLRW